MAYIWQSSTTFSRLDIGPGKMVSLDMVKGGSGIAIAMQLPNRVQVMKVNWAKQNGIVYRPHLVICGKVVSEMPVFYQIESVLIIHEKLVLLILPLCTVAFQEHFHAYELTRTKQDLVVFHVDSLHYPRPFDIQLSYGVNDNCHYLLSFVRVCYANKCCYCNLYVCSYFHNIG